MGYMRVIKLSSENEAAVISETVDYLKRGYTVVYPTETSYVLGGDALRDDVIKRVFAIKKREPEKALPIIVSGFEMMKFLAYFNSERKRIVKDIYFKKNALFRKTPITVILPKKEEVPAVLTVNNSIALRVSSYKFANELAKTFQKPLIATFISISRESPMFSIQEIIDRFKKESAKPDLIIDAGELPLSKPPTLLDLTGLKPKILRIGPSNPQELLLILSGGGGKNELSQS